MRQIRMLLALGLSAGVTGIVLESEAAGLPRNCSPTSNCTDPGYPCDPATKKVACNRTPSDYQVTLFEQSNFGGSCITLEVSNWNPEVGVDSLSRYGFNDCITSIKTGRNVRVKAYLDDHYLSKYMIATYEPGSSYTALDIGADESFSSLVATALTTSDRNNEPIPFIYRGNYPHNGGRPWAMEAQGLAHDRTSWYITNENWLPGYTTTISSPVNPPTNIPQECGLMGCAPTNSTYTCGIFCFASGVPVSQEFKDCIASYSGNHFTGRIYKIPLDEDLNNLSSRTIIRELWQMPEAPNADKGYRHFGDPDVIVINGSTYVFIPVQSCGSQDRQFLPYVLVLDSNLDYYTHFTLPPTVGFPPESKNDPRHKGMGSWVAVDPASTQDSLTMWMSTDFEDGSGLQVFRAQLRREAQQATFLGDGPVLSRYPYTSSYMLKGDSVQGGVFSPAGRILYLTRGTNHNYGGIHAFDTWTGKELTETGNNYGPFNFQQEAGYTDYQEPEGLDFFDTRCSSLTIPGNSGFGAGQSSQLHAILLNNAIYNDNDQVWLKHYSFASGVPPMCDRWLSPWNQGFVESTGMAYPGGFQVFAFGSVAGMQHVEGPVAAQGTVNLSSFSINSGRVQPVAIVANDTLTLANGWVAGTIYYARSKTIAPTVTHDITRVFLKTVIDWGTALQTLTGMSDSLDGRPSNASTRIEYGNVILTGTNSKLNVFSVSAEDLRNTYSIALTVPPTSTVLINVKGTGDMRIANAGLNTNGHDSHKILWNFYRATSVTISSMGFFGSVLAPTAAFTQNWGSIQGTIIAKSVSSTAEMYFYPLQFSGLYP